MSWYACELSETIFLGPLNVITALRGFAIRAMQSNAILGFASLVKDFGHVGVRPSCGRRHSIRFV